MSKLAAICAKLSGVATAAVSTNSADRLFEASPFPPPVDTDDGSRGSSLDGVGISNTQTDAEISNSDICPSPNPLDGPHRSALKRRSMTLLASSSRRKRLKPTSLHQPAASANSSEHHMHISQNSMHEDGDNTDDQSIDGSEQSLRIDLEEDNQSSDHHNTSMDSSINPFHLYSQAAGNMFTNMAMASKSLAAFAEQAAGLGTSEDSESYNRVVSPGSFSCDSLNDSGSRASLSGKLNATQKEKKDVNFSQYLKRYMNSTDCGSPCCSKMSYKEHYHCMDCKSKLFIKKDEMMRHYKWHKKRDESLQHGFMRYSSFDDCSSRFGPCTHNKKQTHYHCVQPGCNKVYVSTSDVQMHANYHRKASAIYMEGFQRFRATEDCGTPSCDFYSQRTTHFHCRRKGCNFTFKNKADMEKHKSYHQKDELLAKDGFKKFMKYEHCPYPGCAYSKSSNHIHCLRPGCMYVLHSTSQLYPHKRKHEKKEIDLVVAKYDKKKVKISPKEELSPQLPQLALNAGAISLSPETSASDLLSTVARLSQGVLLAQMNAGNAEATRTPAGEKSSNPTTPTVPPLQVISTAIQPAAATLTAASISPTEGSSMDTDSILQGEVTDDALDKSLNLSPSKVLSPAAMNWKTERSNRLNEHAKSMMGHFKISSSTTTTTTSVTTNSVGPGSLRSTSSNHTDLWKRYLTRYTANDPCNARCALLYKDHYHCNVPNCFNAFKNKDGVREHARQHDNQERISEQLFIKCSENSPCSVAADCEHSNKINHYHCNWKGCSKTITENEKVFARLEHFQEHELESRVNQASTASIRRRATGTAPTKKRGRPPKYALNVTSTITQEIKPKVHPDFTKFSAEERCPSADCTFRSEIHYHCNKPRCNSVTNRPDVIELHSKNFHTFITIPEMYAYFDKNVNCKLLNCTNNRVSSHYHCLRRGCDYSFIRHNTVALHDKKHSDMDKMALSVQQGLSLLKSSDPVTPEATELTPLHLGLVPAVNQSESITVPTVANQIPKPAASVTTPQKIVKASGTFFPETGIPAAIHKPHPQLEESSGNGSSSDEEEKVEHTERTTPHILPTQLLNSLPQGNQATAMLNLLTQMLILQQKATSAATETAAASSSQGVADTVSNDTWQKMLGRMYASPQIPCGNVFCKKKQVEHYHCLECGTAFNKAHESRLRIHITKHDKYRTVDGSSSNPPPVSTSTGVRTVATGAPLSNMPNDSTHHQVKTNSNAAMKASTSSSYKVTESYSPPREAAVPDSSTSEDQTTPHSIQDIMLKALQLQVVRNQQNNDNNNTVEVKTEKVNPEGYRKYSKAEDCGYSKCAHSKSCTHYHCIRDECGYSVNEEARLTQHTQRHEKLDKIMGDDFKLYRLNTNCGRADCEFTQRTAHFHCLNCPYICTDANRILPHRKNHSTASSIDRSDK